MTITLNGKARELTPGTTVAALLADVVGATRGSAIVLDGEIVPRSEWDRTVVRDGHDVEIVSAVQGG